MSLSEAVGAACHVPRHLALADQTEQRLRSHNKRRIHVGRKGEGSKYAATFSWRWHV